MFLFGESLMKFRVEKFEIFLEAKPINQFKYMCKVSLFDCTIAFLHGVGNFPSQRTTTRVIIYSQTSFELNDICLFISCV